MTQEEKKQYQRDWYQKHKEEVKAKSKKYFNDHKEEQLAKSKIRYQDKKDDILAKQKIYRETHKEQIAESDKKYRQTDNYKNCIENRREKRRAEYRDWYYRNKEEVNAYHREYMKKYTDTKEGRAKQMILNYKREDRLKERGECTLTLDWYLENIFNSKCIYCGDDNWKHLGADRVDNNFPHTNENCVCACAICNVERGTKSVDEFIEYRKIHPRDIKRTAIYGNEIENGVIKKRAVI